MINLPSVSHAAMQCTKEVVDATSIWGDSTVKAAKKSIESGNDNFIALTSDGQVKVWTYKKDKTNRVIISHSKSKSKNPDLEIRLDPENKCGISSISFYSTNSAGKIVDTVVSGTECYTFARDSSRLENDGSEYSQSEKNQKIMIQKIKDTLKNKNVIVDDTIATRIRNNCRNSAVIGRLSRGPLGFSNDFENKQERKIINEKVSAPGL